MLEFGLYGGFTPRDIAFQRAPSLLVTGDGRVISPAAVAAIYPGPLLPQHTVRMITPAGIAALIAAAEDAGLLADVDYRSESELQVADAATTMVRITVDGTTYEHAAYALGLTVPPGDADERGGETPARRSLQEFVGRLRDLTGIVPASELGPEELWVPDAFHLLAEPAGDLSGYEPPARVVDWPSGAGVSLADLALADVGGCTAVDRERIGEVLDTADQLTFFVEGGVTYQLLARPAYPGRSC